MNLLTKVAILMFVYGLAQANTVPPPAPPPPPPLPTVVAASCWPFWLGALGILYPVYCHWKGKC